MQPEPILVADDNENDILLLRTALTAAKVLNPIVGVASTAGVVDYLATHRSSADGQEHLYPCLLLLDIHLGIESGFNVLRSLQTNPPGQHIIPVILTGSASAEDLLQAREHGAEHVLEKPLHPGEYVRLLDSIPGLRREALGDGWVYLKDDQHRAKATPRGVGLPVGTPGWH